MIYRLYLNTSVFGALLGDEDPARVRATSRLLDVLAAGRYEGYIGREVLAEINLAPVRIRDRLLKAVADLSPTILDPTPASEDLFNSYWATGLFRRGSRMDARHLAVATVAGMDALVSWNYRDMVNLGRKRVVHSVNIRLGYHMIDIVSPLEVPDVPD